MPATAPAGWTRTFSDDFTTPAASGQFDSVYGSKFGTYDGFPDTSGNAEYEQSALSVTDGTLNVHLFTDSAGQASAGAIIPLVNGVWGGQTSGRYDVRLRADNLPGYGLAGLLWSDANDWNQGEVDFPEGGLDSNVTLSDHCIGNPSQNCLHQDLATTFTAWHTYTIEWTPSRLTYLVDGNQVATTTTNIPTSPMHFVLQIGSNGVKPPATSDGNVQVAWMTVSQAAG